MSFIPKPHEIYKHFKGNLYQIIAIAEHTETGEMLVVYQAMYGDFKIFARPLSMFVSPVDREKYPDVTQEFRFELQGPEAARQKAETEVCSQTDSVSPKAEMETVSQSDRMNSETVKDKTDSGQTVLPEQELHIDPLVLEFLDADNYEQRLNILAGLHHRITDDMITTMAIACDVEIEDGDTEERYEALKTCLLTLERYECNRLR